MTIVPDAKDWTWVLRRPCPECGLDTRSFAREDLPAMIRANAAAWRVPLADLGAARRPRPGTWSALEYGCHVRDVFKLYDYRLGLMLTEDNPLYPNWDQDETAIADRYDTQDPATVARELAAAAETIAAQFSAVADDQWPRPGRRGDGATFTVETFGRYFIHDPIHHLYDVTGIPHSARLEAARIGGGPGRLAAWISRRLKRSPSRRIVTRPIALPAIRYLRKSGLRDREPRATRIDSGLITYPRGLLFIYSLPGFPDGCGGDGGWFSASECGEPSTVFQRYPRGCAGTTGSPLRRGTGTSVTTDGQSARTPRPVTARAPHLSHTPAPAALPGLSTSAAWRLTGPERVQRGSFWPARRRLRSLSGEWHHGGPQVGGSHADPATRAAAGS